MSDYYNTNTLRVLCSGRNEKCELDVDAQIIMDDEQTESYILMNFKDENDKNSLFFMVLALNETYLLKEPVYTPSVESYKGCTLLYYNAKVYLIFKTLEQQKYIFTHFNTQTRKFNNKFYETLVSFSNVFIKDER